MRQKRAGLRHIKKLIEGIERQWNQEHVPYEFEEIQRIQNLFSRIMFYGLIQGLIDPQQVAKFIERTPEVALKGDYDLFVKMFLKDDLIYQQKFGLAPQNPTPLSLVGNHA